MPTLREMTEEEFQNYSKFSFDTFVEELAKSSGQTPEAVRARIGILPSRTDRDLWLLAEFEGKAIGYLWLQLRPELKAFGYDIHLDAQCRGRGFGRKIMIEAGAILRRKGIRTLEICVFEENHVARNLYQSLGFKEASVDAGRRQYLLRIDLGAQQKFAQPELSCGTPRG